MSVSRRSFFRPRRGRLPPPRVWFWNAQQKPPVGSGWRRHTDPRMGVANAEKLFKYSNQRAKVSHHQG